MPGAVPRVAESILVFPALPGFPSGGGPALGQVSPIFRKKKLRTEKERVKDGEGCWVKAEGRAEGEETLGQH